MTDHGRKLTAVRGDAMMFRRSKESIAYLQEIEAKERLLVTCCHLLRIYDSGQSVSTASWELLRACVIAIDVIRLR